MEVIDSDKHNSLLHKEFITAVKSFKVQGPERKKNPAMWSQCFESFIFFVTDPAEKARVFAHKFFRVGPLFASKAGACLSRAPFNTQL